MTNEEQMIFNNFFNEKNDLKHADLLEKLNSLRKFEPYECEQLINVYGETFINNCRMIGILSPNYNTDCSTFFVHWDVLKEFVAYVHAQDLY